MKISRISDLRWNKTPCPVPHLAILFVKFVFFFVRFVVANRKPQPQNTGTESPKPNEIGLARLQN